MLSSFLFLGHDRLLDSLLRKNRKADRIYRKLNDGVLVDATTKLVLLDSLYCTQTSLDPEAIEKYIQQPSAVSVDLHYCIADLPIVLNFTSRHFVLDGHHRFAGKKLRGMRRAKTYYWDLDRYLREA